MTMTTTWKQLSRPLRLAIAAPWLLLVSLVGIAATPGGGALLLDSLHRPTADVNLASSHWTGTLDDARLSANVPLYDGGNSLSAATFVSPSVLTNVIYPYTGGDPYISLQDPRNGVLGMDGEPFLYWGYDYNNGVNIPGPLVVGGGLTNFDTSGNAVLGGDLSFGNSLTGAGIYGPSGAQWVDNENGGWNGPGGTSILFGGQIIAPYFVGDGRNMTNVPPPAGLYIYPGDDGMSPTQVYIGRFAEITAGGFTGAGSFLVGDGTGSASTVLLSGYNTLGPLDGSALTALDGDIVADSLAGHSSYLSIPLNNGSLSDTDVVIHSLTTASDFLPGDGTASFANGLLTIDNAGNLNASSYYTPGSVQCASIEINSILVSDGSYVHADDYLDAGGYIYAGQGIGLWGKQDGPTTQPSAIVNATDATDVITRVNAILAVLRGEGAIAP